MNKQCLMNGLKIELRLEQFYHSETLRQSRTEDSKKLENIRHEKALKNICDIYENKLKDFEELGLLER